jgi:hypothetical protein
MAKGSSTAEQVQRAKLTLAKSNLSAKKCKKAKKPTKEIEQVKGAAAKVAARLMPRRDSEAKRIRRHRSSQKGQYLSHRCFKLCVFMCSVR